MPTKPLNHQAKHIDRGAVVARLLFIRNTLGMSKKDFGESIGIQKSNYGQIEAGHRMLTVDQVYALYVTYGVPMEYVLAGREVDLPESFRQALRK